METCLGFLRTWCLGSKSEHPESNAECVTFAWQLRSQSHSVISDILLPVKVVTKTCPGSSGGTLTSPLDGKWAKVQKIMCDGRCCYYCRKMACHNLRLGKPSFSPYVNCIGYNWFCFLGFLDWFSHSYLPELSLPSSLLVYDYLEAKFLAVMIILFCGTLGGKKKLNFDFHQE